MPIALITQSTFLRRHFARTRQTLLGQAVLRKDRKHGSDAVPDISRGSFQDIDTSVPLFTSSAKTAVAAADRSKQFPPQERVAVRQQSVLTDISAQGSAQTRLRQWGKSAARMTLTVVMIICFSVVAAVILPDMYYRVFSSTPTAYDEISQAARNSDLREAEATPEPEPEPYQPEFNPNLPKGAWIHIPRIGVYTELRPTENPDEALDKGVWMVPDFGRPGDREQPIIAAAHRFGWDWWWQSDYWKYHSFYLLTETEPGDRVEIIYDQRKWVYEIYESEEGTLISDYDADLILYTCKYLRSPIRYFRYARVVEV